MSQVHHLLDINPIFQMFTNPEIRYQASKGVYHYLNFIKVDRKKFKQVSEKLTKDLAELEHNFVFYTRFEYMEFDDRVMKEAQLRKYFTEQQKSLEKAKSTNLENKIFEKKKKEMQSIVIVEENQKKKTARNILDEEDIKEDIQENEREKLKNVQVEDESIFNYYKSRKNIQIRYTQNSLDNVAGIGFKGHEDLALCDVKNPQFKPCVVLNNFDSEEFNFDSNFSDSIYWISREDKAKSGSDSESQENSQLDMDEIDAANFE
jgi:hypothetical protein